MVEMQSFVERGLEDIGEVIAARWLADAGYREGANPTHNVAAEFTCDVFALRSYCWCDGGDEGHEIACPPNFEHYLSGFRATWYKGLGRGSAQNHGLTRAQWEGIRSQCMAVVLAAEPIPISEREWVKRQQERRQAVRSGAYNRNR